MKLVARHKKAHVKIKVTRIRKAREAKPIPDTWMLTLRQVADVLGVSTVTLRAYRKAGTIQEPDIIYSARNKGYSRDAMRQITKQYRVSMPELNLT